MTTAGSQSTTSVALRIAEVRESINNEQRAANPNQARLAALFQEFSTLMQQKKSDGQPAPQVVSDDQNLAPNLATTELQPPVPGSVPIPPPVFESTATPVAEPVSQTPATDPEASPSLNHVDFTEFQRRLREKLPDEEPVDPLVAGTPVRGGKLSSASIDPVVQDERFEAAQAAVEDKKEEIAELNSGGLTNDYEEILANPNLSDYSRRLLETKRKDFVHNPIKAIQDEIIKLASRMKEDDRFSYTTLINRYVETIQELGVELRPDVRSVLADMKDVSQAKTATVPEAPSAPSVPEHEPIPVAAVVPESSVPVEDIPQSEAVVPPLPDSNVVNPAVMASTESDEKLLAEVRNHLGIATDTAPVSDTKVEESAAAPLSSQSNTPSVAAKPAGLRMTLGELSKRIPPEERAKESAQPGAVSQSAIITPTVAQDHIAASHTLLRNLHVQLRNKEIQLRMLDPNDPNRQDIERESERLQKRIRDIEFATAHPTQVGLEDTVTPAVSGRSDEKPDLTKVRTFDDLVAIAPAPQKKVLLSYRERLEGIKARYQAALQEPKSADERVETRSRLEQVQVALQSLLNNPVPFLQSQLANS
jgi:hypothetical protein